MARAARGFPSNSKKVEEPGQYFHPLLATLITGAARLMLGIAERLCIEKGLDWAFCDTDSLAIAKPDGMGAIRVLPSGRNRSANGFRPSTPTKKRDRYSKSKTRIIQLPRTRKPRIRQFEPLYCYCISAKRYALFNIGTNGEIIIRKASAHGLGQYPAAL